jgi:DNA-directed RNA polymerase specialized sigma24 family protein
METSLSPLRKPLYGYIYRMVTRREDAEDLLQETLVRAIEQIRASAVKPGSELALRHRDPRPLDHLRRKKRWRVETQLGGRPARTPSAWWRSRR